MKTYLVDFENVKSKGLTGIDSLNETDSVIIFYSENSDTISFEMHQKVLCSKAEVEYFKVNVGGKNALDFQLSTLLGYLVGRRAYTHIFVISNDKGFDFLHDFWHGKYIAAPDCTVYRTRTIAAAINYCGEKRLQNTAEPVDEIRQEEAVSEATVDTVEDIAETCESPAAEITAEPEDIPIIEISTPTPSEETLPADEAASEEQSAAAFAEISVQAPVTDNDEEHKAEENAEEYKENRNEQREKKKSKTKRSYSVGYSEKLTEILAPAKCSENDINAISQMLISAETKEELHNSLAKAFKQEATELYKLLRPRYLKLKSLYEQENPHQDTQVKETAHSAAEESSAPQEQTVYSGVISARLAELLTGLCTDEEFEKINELFENASTKQQLYIRMVKAFKKDKGCRFYNAVKGEYTALHG
ncbi:MAG: hypothetical protein J5994_06315 [Ruminococcus sp.]|nr:hypothetical protein [Ruminococcus sp.]